MGRRAVALLCLAALALGGSLVAATAGAQAAPKTARVTVADFYFAPSAVTIRRLGGVTWVWSALNTQPHNVHLRKAPKRLKQRASYSTRTTAVIEARFHKAFPRPGVYRYVCTIHPAQMRLTVTVRR